MNRIFLRFSVLMLLAIAAATVFIYFTFNVLFGDPLEEIALRQVSGQVFLLEQYIDKAPRDEWLVRLNKVREISELSLDILPLQAALQQVPDAKHAPLMAGVVVIDIPGKSFFRRVDLDGSRYVDSDADVMHVQNLPIDVGVALRMEAIRFALIALFLLIPIAWWSRAHWRALGALSRVADDFGQGMLTRRTQVKKASIIYPLASRMDQMAERIAGLLEARKSLLHSVSHELRTPLARLEFGFELLRSAAASPALVSRIAAMEADVQELNTLVSELLNLTQLDHPESLQRKAFALHTLLHDCARALQPSLKNLVFTVDVPNDLGDVVGDQRLLARAVNNLLGNAAKYARTRIVLSARREGIGAVLVTVEDDGPGIPEAERDRVFEPFYRLDREADLARSGFGLGLAIVQKALALHGGSITISTSARGGAKLTLHVPAGEASKNN
jgi:two-component system OmpR family sensor kinase